ncbi:MAG TPA: IS200/IS605 family transposase, partial [Chlorobaculum parvum]|nr:IS200/IS605 family transposase [Chlorobaculum parvum]
ELWTDGYYASTVSKHGNEEVISKYVKERGSEYQKIYSNYQLSLF